MRVDPISRTRLMQENRKMRLEEAFLGPRKSRFGSWPR